jgi:hypothetical protein
MTTFEPAAACWGKQAFPNARTALRSARGKSELAPYRCGHCGQFHIGHRLRQKEKGVKNRNSKMTKPQIANVARAVLALHK